MITDAQTNTNNRAYSVVVENKRFLIIEIPYFANVEQRQQYIDKLIQPQLDKLGIKHVLIIDRK